MKPDEAALVKDMDAGIENLPVDVDPCVGETARRFEVDALDRDDVVIADPTTKMNDKAVAQISKTFREAQRLVVGKEALTGGIEPEALVRGVIVRLAEPVAEAELKSTTARVDVGTAI
jgi:hypothetical protein